MILKDGKLRQELSRRRLLGPRERVQIGDLFLLCSTAGATIDAADKVLLGTWADNSNIYRARENGK